MQILRRSILQEKIAHLLPCTKWISNGFKMILSSALVTASLVVGSSSFVRK